MRVGRLNKWVTLSQSPQTTPDNDGFFEALSPDGVWAAIEPQASSGDARTLFHNVTIRYHPQVTMDTRIVYGTRWLFVKSVQDMNEENVEMRLLCEEVIL